jgi:phosphatidylglycerol:prolipoprotein diacylglycerol transferase
MPVYPFNLHLGPLEVTGYGLMLMVAFLTGGWLIALELERPGLNREFASDIIFAALIGGVVGAKVWYAALVHDPAALFSRGGMVWYGGFIGGVLAVLFNSWRLRVPARWTMQVMAPALAAAYSLGRIGCFLVGDDYGGPTTLPWAVAFPQGKPPSTAGNLAAFNVRVPPGIDPNTLMAVHPTQLYEVGLMFLAFMLLWKLRKKPWGTGAIFGVYLMLAGVERFFIEILRAKDDRFLGGFTLAQLTSVIVALVGVAVFTRLRNTAPVAPGDYLTSSKAAIVK